MTPPRPDLFMPSRRSLLGGALGGITMSLIGGAAVASTPEDPTKAGARTFASLAGQPPTVAPDELTFTPRTWLRPGHPRQVGLDPRQIATIRTELTRFLEPTPENPDHPLYAGATAIAVKDGVIVAHESVGKALRYGLDGTTVVELPDDQQVDAGLDTMWDIASMSKLFTTTAILQLIEQGRLDLEEPVVTYLPEFAPHGKDAILLRHLLTHVSGLLAGPVPSLWEGYDTYEERVAAIMDTEPTHAPEQVYRYSDINLITLGLLVERLSGTTLDAYVRDHVTGPLGMHDTMYNPPADRLDRVAATEYEPWAGRPMIRGEVHDENAWALGGVAGHAGVFSTAADMARFGQMFLNGGVYRGTRILSEETVRLSLHDYTGAQFPGSSRGLGWELATTWYHGPIWSPVSFGHTGYTGTSIVMDPIGHQLVVLMTNRVHPSRDWGSNNPSRRAVSDALGMASAVRPASGRTSWFSGRASSTEATLDVPLPATAGARLRFSYWFDTEPLYDYGRLRYSTDGTTFSPLPFTLEGGGFDWETSEAVDGYGGRRWLRGSADLPAGTTALRWIYETDATSQGRGIFVDDIVVSQGRRTLFDSSRRADAARIVTDGWALSDR
ncbi:CubicO group peptidase (beta-lactamase class C family) [Nocardioides albertanoniae]|uniref:CubicO group peptidase (Beta-lactamase class C family) n=1 Tax=Nocardioides albertanoniae TaxID=1175486 RepID=A0A543A2V1_9ACTN|nr:serine hydrolase domain-containing protein [Nocardioides albertanoniae]TQL66915.1 CubicO group peptidase (beta-lactamase class C family) [Nocardioides albertanoniae]